MKGQFGSFLRGAAATTAFALAALIIIAGTGYALAMWAVMSFYADDVPNTLLQNLSPFLLYILPSLLLGGPLIFLARWIRHRR